MRCHSKHLSPSRGFTVVELLVVIGIISLLIAILLPALMAARSAAKALACEANLRTLGQALLMHANEHRGYMPLVGNIRATSGAPDNPWNIGDAAMNKWDYCIDTNGAIPMPLPEALAPYLNAPQVTNSWLPMEVAMLTGPVRTAFACPADEYNASQTAYTSAPLWINNQSGNTAVGWSSYGYNTDIFGWDPGYSWNRLRGKLSDVPDPSDTMLLMDISLVAAVNNKQQGQGSLEIWTSVANSSLADVYYEGGLHPTSGGVANNIFDLVRHHGRANILCADGHVESAPILANGSTTTGGAAIGTPANLPSGYAPPASGTVPGMPVTGGGSLAGFSLNKGFPKGGDGS